MMVESSFVLLCKPLDSSRHSMHLQVSVEVIVSNVPGCIDHDHILIMCSKNFRNSKKFSNSMLDVSIKLWMFRGVG